MKKIIALLLSITMVFGAISVLASCENTSGNETTTEGSKEQTTEESKEQTTEESKEQTTEESKEQTTEESKEQTTEESKEQTTEESKEQTTEDNKEQTTENDTAVNTEKFPPEPDVEGKLPSRDYDIEYSMGDDYLMTQYNNSSVEEFEEARAYYLQNGYTEYCYNNVGGTLSGTYINAEKDTYETLLFSVGTKELYIGYGKNASNFPEKETNYVVVNDITTITQGYSNQINGMTYIFHIADGSFIIFDGGYESDAENLLNTLYKLNGSKENVHVRAWFLSHSHSDHYPAFSTFAKKYTDNITLDTVFYSPLTRDVAKYTDTYFNDKLPGDVAKFDGAKLCGAHAGMVFNFADVKVEVLYSAEMVYKSIANPNFNESSLVCRVMSDEGSMMILGDIQSDSAVNSSEWLVSAYGEALKSDMVQISHHGVEQATVELYDLIGAPMVFWPCNEWLLNNVRGTTTKQYLLTADFAVEHVIHGYGNVTRPLSYKPQAPETLQLLSSDVSKISGSNNVKSPKIENGVLKYRVAGDDPYVCLDLSGVSTTEYNALKITVKATGFEHGYVFLKCGDMGNFTNSMAKPCGPQGVSTTGVYTMIVYFGNLKNYTGDITSLRLDFGEEAGERVEISSVEAFYVDIDK